MAVRYCIIGLLILAGTAKAKNSDDAVAQEVAAHASVLLHEDVSNNQGLQLLRFAEVLKANCDSVLLIRGYLQRNMAAPKALPTKTSKEELIVALRERGMTLIKDHFRQNKKIGKLALLYLRMADHLGDEEKNTLIGIVYLQSHGVTDDLAALLSEPMDVKDLYWGSDKPEKVEVSGLSKADESLANGAARIGSQMLAKDSGNAKGLTLVRLALHIEPGNMQALQTLAELERSRPVTPHECPASKDKFISFLLKRAEQLMEDTDDDERDAHLALTYYRVAERLVGETRDVMLGIIKMERKGYSSNLDDLLETDLAEVKPQRDDRSLPDLLQPVVVQEDDGTIDYASIQPRKIDISGFASRRKDDVDRISVYADEEVQNVSFIAKIENWTNYDLKDVNVKVWIIGKSVTSRSQCKVLKVLDQKMSIPKNRKAKVTTDLRLYFDNQNSMQYGYNYYGYVLKMTAPDGTEIRKAASSRSFEKLADKIMQHSSGRIFNRRSGD